MFTFSFINACLLSLAELLKSGNFALNRFDFRTYLASFQRRKPEPWLFINILEKKFLIITLKYDTYNRMRFRCYHYRRQELKQ